MLMVNAYMLRMELKQIKICSPEILLALKGINPRKKGLTQYESGLGPWSEATEVFGKDGTLLPAAANNLGLIVATQSRAISFERLLGMDSSTSGAVTLHFDAAQVGKANRRFDIALTKEEVTQILTSEFPVKEAIRITDGRIQAKLAGLFSPLSARPDARGR